MIYYKHFIGDYQRKTNRLSILEDGVYRRLLDEYYSNESPLPLDEDVCFRLVRAIKADERRAVLKILPMYFTQTPDGYIQGRADEQILEFKEKSGKASRSAKVRWNTNADANADANAATKKPCERNATPDPIARSYSQTPNPKTNNTPPYPPEFEAFWSAYPRKIGKAAALKAWEKLDPGLAKQIVTAIEAQVASQHFLHLRNGQPQEMIPLPTTWLNQGRWDDEITPTPEQQHRESVRRDLELAEEDL